MHRSGEPLPDSYWQGLEEAVSLSEYLNVLLELPESNQSIVAGLGNIYVCEALHMAGISPVIPATSVSKPRVDKLVVAIKEVLAAAIKAGGSTLRAFAAPDGERGYFAKDWRVYGREGESCHCGTAVQRRVDSGRSTFFCPKCQR